MTIFFKLEKNKKKLTIFKTEDKNPNAAAVANAPFLTIDSLPYPYSAYAANEANKFVAIAIQMLKGTHLMSL
jgi:hypothetical protein